MAGKFDLTPEQLPLHVGFIMDGNGRWAKKRGMPRKMGHSKGAEVFKRTVEDCRELGIKYCSFYAFSTENWQRPKDEVDALMKLLDSYLDDIQTMARKNTKIIFLGDKAPFEENLRLKMIETERGSAENNGLHVLIALNYGGRDEIIHALRNIAEDIKNGAVNTDELDEQLFEKYLYTKDIPPLDLIIRTSGEQRISNFMIWQGAYAELLFTDVLWPDFTKKHLMAACVEYAGRTRRFGGV